MINMIASILLWYMILLLTGWVVLPLLGRITNLLADRGYNLSKPVGLLLWGYIFWLFTSLGISQNDLGGIFLAFLLTVSVSILLAGRERILELAEWVKRKWRFILGSELLFLSCFIAWGFMRATNPDIIGTEKPMELAFINSILRSATFPPLDPWLSGYSISYYYFGYVIVAMLAKVTGIPGGIAFNLGVASWFALAASAAYGILYSLLTSFWKNRNTLLPGFQALLAPLFILIVSNVEGFLEMLHSLGLFWTRASDGSMRSSFWQWLNILELNNPPNPPYTWIPERMNGTWWWRASRVLQDFDMLQQPREIIDEFPFFSFFLADLHPHVLAMPFVLVAIGFAYHFYLQSIGTPLSKFNLMEWLKKPESWFLAVLFGGLSFLNTWDFPIYVGLFCSVYLLIRFRQSESWNWEFLKETVYLGLFLGVLGVGLYFPFYLGFSSQAGGLLPSLNFFTRGAYFWVMFGTLLIPIFIFLINQAAGRFSREQLRQGLRASLVLMVGLLAVSYLLGLLLVNMSLLGTLISNLAQTNLTLQRIGFNLIGLGSLFLGVHGNPNPGTLLLGSLANRIAAPGAWISLFILIMLTWGLIWRQKEPANVPHPESQSQPGEFMLLVILLGGLLVIFPEFFYLRDQFGWRMNTIFKFYFQVWILWGLAAAYATAILTGSIKGIKGFSIRIGLVIVILIGLAYPFFNISNRFRTPQMNSLSLDGTGYFRQYSPDEMDAVEWLRGKPDGIVAEAVGGSYSGYARVATLTGMQTVLGWPGHESQWRGGANEIGTREQDLERLYRTSDWFEAQGVIQKYNIRYVFIGSLERGKYRVNETKFRNHLIQVYQNASVVIYEVSRPDHFPSLSN